MSIPKLNAVDFPEQWIILARSAIAASCPVDTTEDVLASIPLIASVMGPNGILRLTTLWSFTNSANVKTMRARLGGIGGTQFMNIPLTANDSLHHQCLIRNRGALNSQVGAAAGGLSGSSGFGAGAVVVPGAIDTSAATTLVITGQKATGAETLTLEAYLLELLQGA